MAAIIFVLILFLVIGFTLMSSRSSDAKEGILMPIKFRHIHGIPNLQEGVIIKISSNEEEISIVNESLAQRVRESKNISEPGDKYIIPKTNIRQKTFFDSKMMSEKQKSVIQRSLVGLVIGGGLGAIVGGMSGIGTKQKTETVHFLSIDFVDEDKIEHEALFALENEGMLIYVSRFARS